MGPEHHPSVVTEPGPSGSKPSPGRSHRAPRSLSQRVRPCSGVPPIALQDTLGSRQQRTNKGSRLGPALWLPLPEYVKSKACHLGIGSSSSSALSIAKKCWECGATASAGSCPGHLPTHPALLLQVQQCAEGSAGAFPPGHTEGLIFFRFWSAKWEKM